MSPTNKRSPGAKGISQPFKKPQFKPVVAQLKTGVPAQSSKRPVAPPVYRPQAAPKTAQLKMIGGSSRKPTIATATHRPQTQGAGNVLQMASLSGGSNIGYVIDGHQLFFNQHITAAIGASSRHATTQVSRDRVYIGSIRTFADRNGNNTVTDANVTRTLTATELSWANDAHETYVNANL